MAAGNDDGEIFFWKTEKPGVFTEISSFHAHQRPIIAVAFSPNEYLLASESDDQKITIWDISNLEMPQELFVLNTNSSPKHHGGLYFIEINICLPESVETIPKKLNLVKEIFSA